MDYFKQQLELLRVEKEEDRRSFEALTATMPVQERRANGMTWFPIAIKGTEIGRGDYLSVEVERTTHHDILHQFRFGMPVALFSNFDTKNDRLEGTLTYVGANRMKLSPRVDELPDWCSNGKLGVDAVFDQNSYDEMEQALKIAPAIAEKRDEGRLVRVLTGADPPAFGTTDTTVTSHLNSSQQVAVQKILAANDLAIVHGPPGTGKTTTIVEAIKALVARDGKQILVVAPSNAAVDLLSDKLSARGLNVVRVGNPARVSERLMSLTLDSRMSAHSSMKEIKRLKKQAAEFRDMAHKYKRSFGFAEREQRRALFAEARNISREVERTEQYIADDVLSKAQVVTATLIGANHYMVRQLRYDTVVIDEAGQALEPACWIPILKAQKVVMAGDHNQLPPTIRSVQAARGGLATTLMEKCVSRYPDAVVLLEEQYRMHHLIMGFSSQTFYGGRLKANEHVAGRLLSPGDKPLLFLDTAGCGFDEKLEGTSISNPEEGAFLVRQLTALVNTLQPLSAAGHFPSIAVISPYKHQVEVLKELVLSTPDLSPVSSHLSVNTIDSFQGQERDAVFISMTRSNTNNVIGFLSDVRRMNVAMTRARKKLVVVGDSATLSQLPFYAGFITYAQEHDGYQSAWELVDW